MIVDPTLPKNYLGVRYYGGDNGRTFGVYLNDVLLKNERVTNANGSTAWYTQYDQIPQSVLESIATKDSYKRDQNGNYVLDANGNKVPVVTVRFQGNGTSHVGGVFGLYTSRTNTYDTNADLKALSVEAGTVSPALAAGTHSYTLTVPADATSASLNIDPAIGSGLITINNILIDDTIARTIALNAGQEPTNIVLKSYAQDHVTSATYQISIVRAQAAPDLKVTATAGSRCVAGKVVLTVEAKNADTVPVGLTFTSTFGQKNFTSVQPGKNATHAFTTRATSIPAGTVTVEAKATVNGQQVTSTIKTDYAPRTC
jgi:hypothetical protein